MVFLETSRFSTRIRDLLFEEEQRVLQTALGSKADLGGLIQGSGGIRKVRWAASGRGKRGGAFTPTTPWRTEIRFTPGRGKKEVPMRKVLLAAAVFLAMCSAAECISAEERTPGRIYTPEEIGTLFLGKRKGDMVGAAGTPDKMYGVMGEEGVPANFSAHWVYKPPKIGIVDPGTGKSPDALHIWFNPNDRVERVTLDLGQ
jgi:hypothetical protein